jgi:hypothetical protein
LRAMSRHFPRNVSAGFANSVRTRAPVFCLLALAHCTGTSGTPMPGASGNVGVGGGSPALGGASSGGIGGASSAGSGTSGATLGCGTYSSGDETCDQCLQGENPCCNAALACSTPDEAGVNDAGRTRCEQLLDCIYDCASGLSGSGGAPPSYAECQATCKTGYSESEYLGATGLTTCAQTLCPAQCVALK